MSDQEANNMMLEIERNEITKNIYGMASALQQICNLSAEKLGLNTQITISATVGQEPGIASVKIEIAN